MNMTLTHAPCQFCMTKKIKIVPIQNGDGRHLESGSRLCLRAILSDERESLREERVSYCTISFHLLYMSKHNK